MTEHAPKSFADLIAEIHAVPEVQKAVKTAIVPSSMKRMKALCPELVAGLLDKDGKPHAGAEIYQEDGTTGPKGALYVVRAFVKIYPSDAAWILNNMGEGNRAPIPARQKAVIEKQQSGEWQYVGNTAVFTVDEVGGISPNSQEQHNAGHTFRGILVSGIPVLVTMIFGIPKSARDKIDDNAARSAKDIASTRSEIKEYFQEGQMIGGAVRLTSQLSKKCTSSLTEALRIVRDVRDGKAPKSGGSRDKIEVGKDLDYYAENICKAIGYVVCMDSVCETFDSKTGKKKTSGGLSKRIPYNHSVALLCLAASYLDHDGNLAWDDEAARGILESYLLLANENRTDSSEPMISLRNTIDRWNVKKMHNDSTGKNVRFAAVKMALLKQADGEEIRNPDWLEGIDPKIVTSDALKIGGIDDYTDNTASIMAAASQPTLTHDPLPTIEEDEDEDEDEEEDDLV